MAGLGWKAEKNELPLSSNKTKSDSASRKKIKKISKREKIKEDIKDIFLLSLLNIIDEIASHERRVLVMTTNHLENLDETLICFGRVNLKIEFTLASRAQIQEIFICMY